MKAQGKDIAPPPRDPLILKYNGGQLDPDSFVLKIINQIMPSHLNDVLLGLPFSQVISLFKCIETWVVDGKQPTLCAKIVLYLLQIHHDEIVNTKALTEPLAVIKTELRKQLINFRDQVGYNHYGLVYLAREYKANQVNHFGEPEVEEDDKKKRKRVVVVS